MFIIMKAGESLKYLFVSFDWRMKLGGGGSSRGSRSKPDRAEPLPLNGGRPQRDHIVGLWSGPDPNSRSGMVLSESIVGEMFWRRSFSRTLPNIERRLIAR
jgi:hypothetical protein